MNLLSKDINIEESIEIAKDELNFLKTYINNNTLEDYVSLSSRSIINVNKNRNYSNSNNILVAIEKYDYHKKIMKYRLP